MTEPVDLDRLDALFAAAGMSPSAFTAYVREASNAYPALREEIRALRERATKAEAWRDEFSRREVDGGFKVMDLMQRAESAEKSVISCQIIGSKHSPQAGL